MSAPIDRRRFLQTTAGLGAAAAGLSISAERREPDPPAAPADPPLVQGVEPYPANRPRVILIRFGGGVRRQETIADDARTWCPFIYHELYRNKGTLFRDVRIANDPKVVTSHGEGTLYLLTGRYEQYKDVAGRFLGNRYVPQVPTIPEYLRSAYAIPEHQALIVNGEDRIDEDFFTYSNCPHYGVRYRSTVLSLHRFKTFILRDELEKNSRWVARGRRVELTAEERRQRQTELAKREQQERISPQARPQPGEGLPVLGASTVGLLGSPVGQGPLLAASAVIPGRTRELDAFWDRWRDYYGSSGFVNPRGDRLLTTLSLWALRYLRPKLLMINYQDPDYVHWGNRNFYTRAIAVIDEGVREIYNAVQADEEYRDHTVFLVVPDCGRDSNRCMPIPYQHHFNTRSAREIFAVAAGPGVARSQTPVDHTHQQAAVAATVGRLMNFRTDQVDRGAGVLEEIWA